MTGGDVALPKIWAWFQDVELVRECLKSFAENNEPVSVAFCPPEGKRGVLAENVRVVGPLKRELDCYPFLDLVHQIRRLGVSRPTAERYASALENGGVLVCVESRQQSTVDYLARHRARDLVG